MRRCGLGKKDFSGSPPTAFSRLYLIRMHLKTFGEFDQRAIAVNGGEGDLLLEGGTMGSACAS